MKLFGTGLAAQVDMSPTSDFWYTPAGSWTNTGKTITEVAAMNVSAFYAGTRLIAETMGMLPVFMFRRVSEREKRKDLGHPLHDILHNSPNEFQDSMQWREMITAHAVMIGNGYSEIQSGRRGFANSLHPLNPSRMEIELLDNGRVKFVYRRGIGEKKTYAQDEIFHLKGFGYGLKGISLLTAMRETLGLAIAMEEHGAGFFGRAAAPAGYLSHPESFKKPETRAALQQSFDANYSGVDNHFKTLVLEEGMKWEPISISNKDSQFLEGRQFLVNEIARWLRLPPHLVGDLTRSTYSNITQQDLEFVKYAMLPWVKRWEYAIGNQLILARQTYFAEFILEMLLRADIETRMKAYQIAIQNGILNRNEVRELENRNPYDGGDEYLTPLNMTTAREPDGREVLVVREGDDIKAMPLDEHGYVKGDIETVEPLPPAEEPKQLPARADAIVQSAADRVIRKEISSLGKRRERSGEQDWEKWVRKFYSSHVGYVEETLSLDETKARRYCAQQMGEVLFDGPGVVEHWNDKRTEELAALALQE